MKKNLIFILLVLGSFGCLQEEFDEPEPFNPGGIAETWMLVLDFQEQHFELESYQVNKLVANTDPLDPHVETVVGRGIKFKESQTNFKCTMTYTFESQAGDFAFGSFQGVDFSITGIPDNPVINFCGGKKNIPVTYKIEKIE